MKRCIDLVLSAAVLLVLSPLLVAVAAAIWLESGRPVLFRQQRVGSGLRIFYILKFRTMRTGGNGPTVTVKGDSRITRIGRILRVTKLDELPQLWNVIRGDMSLVGPRPEVPEYVELYRERYKKILTVRPGITDLASIQFRNEEEILAGSSEPLRTYSERVLPAKLDLADMYIQKRSVLLDLSIMIRTACAILYRAGSK